MKLFKKKNEKAERAMQLELHMLENSIKLQFEEQTNLALKLESDNGIIKIQNRNIRLLKSKIRELKDIEKSLSQWVQISSKVAFDKIKNKVNNNFQKSKSLLDNIVAQQNQIASKIEILNAQLKGKSDNLRNYSEEAMSLQIIESELLTQVEKLRDIADAQSKDYQMKSHKMKN